ncbi:MAG: hypothetical protein JRM80_14380 [Nitrososphaerota archaeon]|nr:hypothetical protein [Nitrososphaerota archaeon]MDG6991504.1 hypothetical protein [Nitrososphaerota archaeon]
MSSSGRYGDLSGVLYLVPFLASGVYGIYLWVQAGISAVLPTTVYLTVTRSPYLFIIGSVAMMLAVTIDLQGTEAGSRKAAIPALGNRLQSVAIASLILTVVAAFYSNGFINVGGAASDFIIGRYGLVFPGVLVLLSYLITARYDFNSLRSLKAVGVIALLLVPVSVYEIGKRQTALGLGIAFVLLLVGLVAYIFPQRRATEQTPREQA